VLFVLQRRNNEDDKANSVLFFSVSLFTLCNKVGWWDWQVFSILVLLRRSPYITAAWQVAQLVQHLLPSGIDNDPFIWQKELNEKK
jgi:hypothetical protein